MMRWWDLPGPGFFVSSVAQDLREGRNVILALPRFYPEGLRAAIREGLDEEARWTHLAPDNAPTASPLDYLYKHFIYESLPDDLRTVCALAGHANFCGRVVWIDGLTCEARNAWVKFLNDYEPTCRNRSLLSRSVFCIVLEGESPGNLPREDVCLSVRLGANLSESTDMLLYTAGLLGGIYRQGMHDKIKTWVISTLAMWDPILAERFVAEPLKTVLKPLQILKEFAKERDWLGNDGIPFEPSWEQGMKEYFEGRERIHSAMCFDRHGEALINRRIWSGEVSVLYPFIEEQRQAIIERTSSWLDLPMTTRFNELITDAGDLEVGHIESLLTNSARFPDRAMINRVRTLRRIRNELAHLKPVPHDLVHSEALSQPLSSSANW